MNYISLFDVIGPNMIGPSSSHTAGAAAIALLSRKLFQREPVKAVFTLYGSFAETYRGHGTDKALLGGVLGSFRLADEAGLTYQFNTDRDTSVSHPNTADILLCAADGSSQFIRGESIGGGKIKIVKINNVDVEFTGEYSTLIVKQIDRPGVVAHLTSCLSHQNVNIAFMRLFREAKGAAAYTIIESDEYIPETIVDEIKQHSCVQETTVIQIQEE